MKIRKHLYFSILVYTECFEMRIFFSRLFKSRAIRIFAVPDLYPPRMEEKNFRLNQGFDMLILAAVAVTYIQHSTQYHIIYVYRVWYISPEVIFLKK